MINKFVREFFFLSNFYPVSILYEEITYPSVEHTYQAAKTLSVEEKKWIRNAPSAGEAKRRGRQVNLKADWHNIKVPVMEALVRQKFSNQELKTKLLRTGDERIIENNDWGDTFWGVCDGVGENKLGKLLMKIREEMYGIA